MAAAVEKNAFFTQYRALVYCCEDIKAARYAVKNTNQALLQRSAAGAFISCFVLLVHGKEEENLLSLLL
jgi:hypothetical protein